MPHRSTTWWSLDLDYLGAGEREAIMLAEELGADWLIIDDRHGRQEAARQHLPVIGTLRVLDEAAERGLINLPDAIELSFSISPVLRQDDLTAPRTSLTQAGDQVARRTATSNFIPRLEWRIATVPTYIR